MRTISRRQFIKYGGGGLAAVVIGSQMPWVMNDPVFSAVQTQFLDFHITDAVKDMVTHNTKNSAQCYFWIYKLDRPLLNAECPGPIIFVTEGDTVNVTLENDLAEPHAFFIPGIVDSGPINPGQIVTGSFVASKPGCYLYYDNLNAPVNRVMGLHGAMMVMPKAPVSGHRYTPYANPTPGVQKLFDDFGNSAHFPGIAWEDRDDATKVPPFRQYLWLLHQASPVLFREVGRLQPGEQMDPQVFMDGFLRDPFHNNADYSRLPQYFTINGQSGFFAHDSSYITPIGRVGEPVVIRILNAGLWTHSMHLHANHTYITSVNDEVQKNPIWVDVFNVHPMDKVDYTVPFMRPPDIPNARGIGRPDTPLTTLSGKPTWPPVEEFDVYLPPKGSEFGRDGTGKVVDLCQRQSPLCYPMHDHSEPTQTSQGGNYNTGLISGIYFVGDRNTPGHMDFPMDEDFLMMYGNVRGCDKIEEAAPPHHHSA